MIPKLFKSTALTSALMLALAGPAYACGCCGASAAAKDGQKPMGGCMGGMSGATTDNQSKKPMCGMSGMSMAQQQSDNAMMGGMDHSKMETGAVATAPAPAASSEGDDADSQFAKAMVPHHRGAIELATEYLKTGKNAEMRKLAEDIVKAQEREIAFLGGWLAGAAK